MALLWEKDVAMGVNQHFELLLEIWAVFIYVLSPCTRGCFGRDCDLVADICIIIDLYKPKGYSTLPPGFLDQDIASTATPIVHTAMIASLGLLEKMGQYCANSSGTRNCERKTLNLFLFHFAPMHKT